MPKVKVLPVYPRFPETFWGYRTAIGYVGKKAIMPPTGLATVLAMLPEKRFEPQRIIDLNVEPLTDEQIKDSDIIFTSTMIIQEDSHNEVLDRAKFYNKPVVAGGPFPTSYPERNSLANCLVTGEAEVTLQPFLEDLANGAPKEIYTEKSVADRIRGLVQLTKKGKVDITQTPLPRWDLLDLRNYFAAAIQYSRGCPFDCEFCDITTLYGREPRTKTPEQMVAELNALYERDYRGPVDIVDDNFIGNGSNLRKMLPAAARWEKERGYPFSLFTEVGENLAWDTNQDILRGMVDAGFDQVFMGIESVDTEVLRKMRKGQNTKMPQLDAVRKIQKAGLEVTAGFIVGNDEEKPDVFKKLFDFIQEAGIVVPMPGLLTALKGTRLYNRLEKEGRLRKESRGNNTHHLEFNFKPEQDEEFLIRGYKGLLKKLFEPQNYYKRCRVLQKNLGANHSLGIVNPNGIKAFGKSLGRQLFARGGLEYATYLLETAVKNPRYFPMAVSQAIKLDHFRAITDATLKADDYIPQTENLYEQFKTKVAAIHKKHSGEVKNALEQVKESAYEILEKAQKGYDKLHKDFRDRAEVALSRLRKNIDEVVGRYSLHGIEGLISTQLPPHQPSPLAS